MIRRPPRSTPFPTRRSSDLAALRGGRPGRHHRRGEDLPHGRRRQDRKSTRLNSSHQIISYAVFCLKKKKKNKKYQTHKITNRLETETGDSTQRLRSQLYKQH